MSGSDRDLRADFPILQRQVKGKPLAYLDNAATTQKPAAVIEALNDYYRRYNSNVHRSVHTLGEEATLAYEEARAKVARFLNAARPEEVVFTSGTSEALNLLAYSLGVSMLSAGDAIVLTDIEHHSNLVPWQLVAQRTGAELRFWSIPENGDVDLEALAALLDDRVKLISLTHCSNVLGIELPVEQVAQMAHDAGALVIVDAAQSVAHRPIDVQALGIDFLAFSGHKVYGPTGIGALWGRYDLLEQMPPFLGGGEMIQRVELERSTYAAPPARFEAGTPKIAQAIGLGAALDYVREVGFERIQAIEHAITRYACDALAAIDGLTVFGPPADRRASLVTFVLDDVHAHDLASIVDDEGVAIRAGHHCCMPLHAKLGVPATARASFALYNTKEDVDRLVHAIHTAKKVFRVGH